MCNGKTKKEMGRFFFNCLGILLGLFERNRQTNGCYFRVMIDPLEGHTVKDSYPSLKTFLNIFIFFYKINLLFLLYI